MSAHHDDHGYAHVMSPQVLLTVFGALIVLTILTVALAGNLPANVELVVALSIATVKGLLVVLFFMHMIHDKPLNILMFVFSLAFVALFLGFALMDTGQYKSSIQEYEIDHIQLETP